MLEGRIIKALSGFYYVKTHNQIYQTRGRGLFRNQSIKPLVGDLVKFDAREEMEGYITEILPRRNELIRPPIANIDQAIVMSSAENPSFSPLLLDRFLVLLEAKQIHAVIVISKMDLAATEKLAEVRSTLNAYEALGYPVLSLSAHNHDELQKLEPHINNKVSVIAGQSGVGKSTLINALDETLELETGAISKSLGRGRHTTRHVELLEVYEGLVADTPGFSSIDFSDIELQSLSSCFPEIRNRQDDCKFRGCSHRTEPGCAVKAAVEAQEIATFRYNHYLRFYEEIQSRKPRY
ncbi:putative ribosome bioproteinis GTPase RsgA [Lentibacillus sp. JNUCC-1]|uniref:ribosome small subunit-dependent GTPase A n=1 Tax=Lentibacillus sp. JNUCC-1 TaxID=2654513 RepID=UPI0012E95547|nr:ribosome small subunit-dependent GTPase A [Lentibacillus sp. JNUCC-1]MUV40014.1 putative ribosome bioproteinis GTPase RsgA [Lentibacillus sp. JNUCC-1]